MVETTLSMPARRFQFKINPSMWAIMILAGLFFLVSISDIFTQPKFELSTGSKDITIPYNLNINSSPELLIKIPRNINQSLMVLDFTSSKQPQVEIKKNINPFAKVDNIQCHKLIDKYLCNVPFDRTNEDIYIKLTAIKENISIDTVSLRLLKSTSNPLDINKSLTPIFILIIMSLPLIWSIHHRKILSQYLIIIISLLCLLWVQPIFTCVLLTYLYTMYFLGRKMQRVRQGNIQIDNSLLLLYIILISAIIFLILSKYGLGILASIFANPGDFSTVMPLGISYFIIRLIDTMLRFYRGEVKHTSFREFLCFIIFLPTIPAGPIDSIDNFMNNRLTKISREDIAYGLSRIVLGIAKKIILVGFLLKKIIFGGKISLYYKVLLAPNFALTHDVLLLPFLMMLYAYLDFSAYSDLAIGLSRMMGYKMVENFNWPIFSRNIQEFWKRWHMSLSGWCMRNIYLPITIKTRSYSLPLYFTMLAVGLWHAFNLSWFTWAVHHSSGLNMFALIQKYLKNPWIKFLLGFVNVPLTLIFVASGYYFAFVNDFSTAWSGYLHFWKSFIP